MINKITLNHFYYVTDSFFIPGFQKTIFSNNINKSNFKLQTLTNCLRSNKQNHLKNTIIFVIFVLKPVLVLSLDLLRMSFVKYLNLITLTIINKNHIL